MNKVYLLIGGNLGDRLSNLDMAKTAISQSVGKIIIHSSIYETAPWGNDNQPMYLNQVLLVDTILAPSQLMQKLLEIEASMGRVRNGVNQPRSIDLDILYFNDQIINEEHLIIPHPRIHFRKFVLIPLNEIESNLMDPLHKKSVGQLLLECRDELEVHKISLNVNKND